MSAIKLRFAGLGCIFLLVIQCATVRAPSDWLPSLGEAEHQAFGGWLYILSGLRGQDLYLQGEFIADDVTSVYVLASDRVAVVPKAEIHQATLTIYKSQAGAAGELAALGVVSTISHGWYAILSAPIWLLVGIGVTATESYSGFLEYPKVSWDELRKFARFPQGIPKGLDLERLKPKPVENNWRR